MDLICAGIVLYNPDIERLKLNINSIINQVEHIILVDNFSSNFNMIADFYKENSKVSLISNNQNLGVATGLNQIAKFAKDFSYEWIYLLDQDSISSPTIIKSYTKYFSHNRALFTPYIIDINKTSLQNYKSLKLKEYDIVNWAITSGSMIDLSIWEKIGKFDDFLFIDGVDIDYSIRLRYFGYTQIRVNTEYLLQEVGKATPTMIFRPYKNRLGKIRFKRHFRSNHDPLRIYYMIRNSIILMKKYKRETKSLNTIRFLSIFILSKILFEKNKLKVIKAIISGISDGLKYKKRG